ncbi:MAG: PIN domain-containing protein [Solirubrobacteraceae bacterium]
MSALADTSVWITAIRRRDERFFGAVEDGDVLGCPIVTLELLTGLRNASELREWRALLGSLTTVTVDTRVTDRAEEVLDGLADLRGGRHRDVPIAALLIAACAECHGVPLWHADRHFEQIARVTGQPQHRLTFDD